MRISGDMIFLIDKSYDNLLHNDIFRQYFKNTQLEKIEDEFYLSNKSRGIEGVFDSAKILITLHLYPQFGKITKHGIDGPFEKLEFALSQDEVTKLLGEPDEKGDETYLPGLGKTRSWQRYIYENISIRFEFSGSKSKLTTISIASGALESYFAN